MGAMLIESMACRRTSLIAVLALTAGCSFVGARVPAEPAPDHDCPSGVIVADGLGTALLLVPTVVGTIAMLDGQDSGDVQAAYILPAAAILAGVYAGSTIYGVRQGRRCERAKERVAARRAADQRRALARPDAPVRAAERGARPLHCAITEPDVGACFFDEAACATEAEREGVACEVRPAGHCFDVVDAKAAKQLHCAASRLDCDSRRAMFTIDAALTVSTCGRYEVSGSAGAPAPASPAPPRP